MKYVFFSGLILILAIFLRFFSLSSFPIGLYSDEVAYGYNAYSILKTGKDEYGVSFPLAFRSFGDYKAPLYIYSLVPFLSLFGLSAFGVRSASAVFGVLLILGVQAVTSRLFPGKKRLSLFAGLFVATSPFALQFHRMAHENTLVVVLVVFAIYFFLLFLHTHRFLTISVVLFALSLYAYHDARVFVPLLCLGMLFVYRRHFLRLPVTYFLPIGIGALLVLPLFLSFLNPDTLSRPKHTFLFSDPGIVLTIQQERGEDALTGGFPGRLGHNKFSVYLYRFMQQYAKHLSPDFLFFSGDPIPIYHTIGYGIIPLSLALYLFLGGILVLLLRTPHAYFLLLWFFLAPVSPALTRFAPSASRMLLFLPVSALFISLGVFRIWQKVSTKTYAFVVFLVMVWVYSIDFFFFLHSYYVHVPLRYAHEWHAGMQDVMQEVKKIQDRYETVWFSKNAWGYMYPLFFLSYPPEKYQQYAHLGPINEYGFGWVREFDSYVFDDFPSDYRTRKRILFVGTESDFQTLPAPIATVLYPTGDVAFYLADWRSFSEHLK